MTDNPIQFQPVNWWHDLLAYALIALVCGLACLRE
jgi:hypothetical protein